MRPIITGVALLILLFISNTSLLAQEYLPYSAGQIEKSNNTALSRNLELTAGYVPNSGSERLKASLEVNNLLLHRVGAYTSFEYDLDAKSFINITGGSITLHRFIYVWGGMDLFSKNGLIQSGFSGPRKEIGIGITPYKFVVARVGWSNSVGLSLAAGVRIPL